MADVFHEGRFGHTADEIGVHHRPFWRSTGFLVALLAAALVGLLALWSYSQNRSRSAEDLSVTPPGNLGSPEMGTRGAPPVAGVGAMSTGEGCSEFSIEFDQDETALSDEDRDSVRELADCLKANPTEVIRIEGRSDAREMAAYDETLSRGRAEALAGELSALGVPNTQYSIAVGEAVCTEGTEDCWRQSRTVSVVSAR